MYLCIKFLSSLALKVPYFPGENPLGSHTPSSYSKQRSSQLRAGETLSARHTLGIPPPLETDFPETILDPLGHRSPTSHPPPGSVGTPTLTDGIGTCHLDLSAADTGAGPAPKDDNGNGGDPKRRKMTGDT